MRWGVILRLWLRGSSTNRVQKCEIGKIELEDYALAESQLDANLLRSMDSVTQQVALDASDNANLAARNSFYSLCTILKTVTSLIIIICIMCGSRLLFNSNPIYFGHSLPRSRDVRSIVVGLQWVVFVQATVLSYYGGSQAEDKV